MLLNAKTHRLHYDLVGPETGKVVCFAHALLADGGMWSEQVTPVLNAGYRVLRIDMRGHGGSDAPPGPCSVSDLAGDALCVLDHLKLSQVHFVGLSIGGVIGQALALSASERLFSLVLSDTNPASAPNAKVMWSERIAIVEKAQSTEPLAAPMMDRLLSASFRERNPTRWQEVFATVGSTRPAGLIACGHALQNFDFVERLPTLKVPTLVLCGANDPATPPSEAQKIVDLIPGARYEEIPDALHFPNIEQAAVYSKALLGWFGQVDGQ